jgi:hypothetical protein
MCGRPMLRRVHDRATRTEEVVPIPWGSTREAVCSACARKARIIGMLQCTEGWHLTDEPNRPSRPTSTDDGEDLDEENDGPAGKRVRSTKRRQNLPDMPKLKMSDRTVGQVFTTRNGKRYRPCMFATCTLPSGCCPPGLRCIRARTTIGGPRWTRCTFPSCAAGCGPTCGAAPGSTSSTSPSSKPNAEAPHTCTPPSVGRSPPGDLPPGRRRHRLRPVVALLRPGPLRGPAAGVDRTGARQQALDAMDADPDARLDLPGHDQPVHQRWPSAWLGCGTRRASRPDMARRKPNGASTVYEAADGWHGRVTDGVKDDGSPDRRHVGAGPRRS